MKKITLALIIGLIAVAAVSCKKYEEGPMISLHTKKSRMAGFWKMEYYLLNGQDITTSYLGPDGEFIWQIKKDGTCTEFGGSCANPSWQFEEKKTMLHVCSGENYHIMRLTGKELWLSTTGDIDQNLIKFKQ